MPKSIKLGQGELSIEFSTVDCFKEAVFEGAAYFDENDFCIIDMLEYSNGIGLSISKQGTIELRDFLTSIIDGD